MNKTSKTSKTDQVLYVVWFIGKPGDAFTTADVERGLEDNGSKIPKATTRAIMSVLVKAKILGVVSAKAGVGSWREYELLEKSRTVDEFVALAGKRYRAELRRARRQEAPARAQEAPARTQEAPARTIVINALPDQVWVAIGVGSREREVRDLQVLGLNVAETIDVVVGALRQAAAEKAVGKR